MQVTIKEAQGAQSPCRGEKILLLREILSDETEDLVEMHTQAYCFEYNMCKLPCHPVLICWKFEYKQS